MIKNFKVQIVQNYNYICKSSDVVSKTNNILQTGVCNAVVQKNNILQTGVCNAVVQKNNILQTGVCNAVVQKNNILQTGVCNAVVLAMQNSSAPMLT